MKATLKERDDWRTKKVKEVIKNRFGVEYSLKDVRILITVLIKSCLQANNILKSSGMKYARPYQRDYRRHGNAEKEFKKLDCEEEHHKDEGKYLRLLMR
ncbi:hypothetical protein FHEFKHOI_01167 [Candidatus Methanoperedenaceae archaeon GB50]|nr:hypothetical protein FHEFKHOI_01167 [Candidatus Methanoperedenaceae archaeon GB50]